MSGWRGFLAGMLGLIALQTVVGTRQGPGRAAGIIDVVTGAVAAFVDPTRPAIGQHASGSGGTGSDLTQPGSASGSAGGLSNGSPSTPGAPYGGLQGGNPTHGNAGFPTIPPGASLGGGQVITT